MSVDGRIIIADLTRAEARVGLATLGESAVEVPDDFRVPQRVAVRQGATGLSTVGGEAAADARADAHTVVFNRLHKLLPRMGDAGLRSRLAAAAWGALCLGLERRGFVEPATRAAAYVIPHHLSTQTLLEEFRTACAGASVRPVGFVHEAAALVLGFVRAPLLPEAFPAGDQRATICLVVAYDETGVEVACFDHSAAGTARRRLLIRDFFHTTCVGLKKALEGRPWAGAVTHFVSVEDEGVRGGALEALIEVLQSGGAGATKKRVQTQGAHRLKIEGAAYVAQCCHGRGDPSEEYSVSNAYSVGVQVDSKRFHAVLDGQEASAADHFPRRASQTFALQGQHGGKLRLNLCCGYSGRISEAIPLGDVVLPAGEFGRGVSRKPAVTVAVVLDATGGGQFVLETAGTKRPLATQSFVLPGLLL